MADRYITLIRHGKHDRAVKTGAGGDLLPEGIQQAEYVADALLQQAPAATLYSSNLTRAVSTARIIAAKHRTRVIKKTNYLAEAIFHVPQKAEVAASQYQHISPEVVTSHRNRMEAAYMRFMRPALKHRDEHDVLVCHGNVIRYFVVRAMNAPIDLWTQMDIHNASITRLIIRDDWSVKLITHNEIGHLPRHLWTLM